MHYFWSGPVNPNWGPGLVNPNWGPGLVNTKWGSGPVNLNWGPGPVNTNWGPGPGAEKYKDPFENVSFEKSIKKVKQRNINSFTY